MGDGGAVGRPAPERHGDQERTLEPPAVLVPPLDVEVGGPGHVGTGAESGQVAAAGIEPDVQDIELLAEITAAAAGALRPFGEQFTRCVPVPGVGPLAVEDGGDMLDDLPVEQGLATPPAVEGDDGHPPGALARNAPVGPLPHHVADPFLAPGGDPADILDRLQRRVPEAALVHRDEPLRRGAEDDGLVAAPAVRVGMLKILAVQQRPRPAQQLDDRGIGGKHRLPAEMLHGLEKTAVIIHRAEGLQPVIHAGDVVVRPVPRGGVHATGAGIQRHVIGQHQERCAVDERVARPAPVQGLPLEARDLLRLPPAALRGDRGEQLGRDDVAPVPHPHRGVVVFGVEGDSQVGGEGPRSGGPDDDGPVPAAESGVHLGKVRLHREGDIDRGAGMVLVLHLRFGQRRQAGRAPVDRLQSLVHQTLVDAAAERARDLRLVAVAHGQVGIIPLAEHLQPLESLSLDVDKLFRVLATLPADSQPVQFGLSSAQLLLHLDLDREPVTVPAGDVGRVEPHHGPRLHDDVLENLVERVPHVDGAVGVRRPVVQHEPGGSGARPADLPVDVDLVPVPDHFRFAHGKVRFHPKGSLRKVQGVLDL